MGDGPERKRRRREAVEERVWSDFHNCWTVNGEPVEEDDAAGGEAAETWVPLKERRAKLHLAAQQRRQGDGGEASDGEGGVDAEARAAAEEAAAAEAEEAEESQQRRTLLNEAAELREKESAMGAEAAQATRQQAEEARMLREAARAGTNALLSAAEIASDAKFTESLRVDWRPEAEMSRASADALRKKWCILVDGDDVPAPIKTFEAMGLPSDLLSALAEKKIKRPTPIQVQGMPVALSGRDMIGIAFTGSGKTVAFSIPLLIRALEAERRDALRPGEGPVGLILCPSRELARQTWEVVDFFMERMDGTRRRRDPRGGHHPRFLRSACCIGGEQKGAQLDAIQRHGAHAIVATPGRLRDFLENRKVTMDRCCYFCLDEGDRMLDLGFDEEVHKIMNHFKRQRQTLLFSATMPQKFQDFARGALVRSVLVNVSRAGAANLDVIQEVEYVKLEARIVYLLECLQKTAPPVVIFCERKGDVDDIHEYLLLKGVEAVSIHGGKDQAERNAAIDAFKRGHKDVLVATDIAAKGLDFPDIQHVINFDMPSEIENYVHRIGRTGRCGKTGVATTFINKTVEPSSLLDLKHLLIEAKQRVPPVLQVLDEPEANALSSGVACAFCGGLGHRITECPKRDKDARRLNANRRDMISGTGGVGGDW